MKIIALMENGRATHDQFNLPCKQFVKIAEHIKEAELSAQYQLSNGAVVTIN